MNEPGLVIVGAGPKAMAIVAKASVLAAMGFDVPPIHVIERTAIGANWSGAAGYTSGRQPLGTSPEKDIGFPYHSTCWGHDLAEAINAGMTRFSWQNFLVANDQFSDWVDRGRPAPEHQQWARYLQWVATGARARFQLHHGEVRHVSLEGDHWRVTYADPTDGHVTTLAGLGLVMTGPGRVMLPPSVPTHPRIFTVETFWRAYAMFQELEDAHVTIVGTGETAAAIAMGLVRPGKADLRIDIVSPLGMAYSRGESFRENRVYSDPVQGNWGLLTPQHRRDFIKRTDRGVFSQAATRLLDHAENIEIVAGRMASLQVDAADHLVLELEYNDARQTMGCDFVVLATGADQLIGLNDLLDDAACQRILAASRLPELTQEHVEGAIQWDLSLRGLTPRLHLPMLAGFSQGPGFANLSCLGRLSDRILEYYVVGAEPPTTDEVGSACPAGSPVR